ncbi:MAG: hypothetical protein R6V50_06360 [Thermoplasmatota archaeon]
MIKKTRTISAHSDLKTGFLSKLLITIGLILALVYIINFLVPLFELHVTLISSILAFSIIFIGLGLIFYFMSLQFAKLAKIAKEIEEIENEYEIKYRENEKKE